MGRRRGFARDELRAAQAAQFAAELAAALHELRLTHKELAQALGVTHHTVDSWTRVADPMLPTAANLERLVTWLEQERPGLGRRLARAAGRTVPSLAGDPAAGTPVPGAGRPGERSRAGEPAAPVAGGPTNLPPALTSFVGREAQIREIAALLGATRLLTLTGPGGVGKTRLALQVADRARRTLAHGVWLVEFEALRDPALVPGAVAAVFGIRDAPGRPLGLALAGYLRDRQLLLLFDNCEHLIEAAAALAEDLLGQCPRLQILATSREPLRCRGETVWTVPPLTLPPGGRPAVAGSVDDVVGSEAGRLFLERARAAHPAFAVTPQNAADLGRVCRRLDGIPLAVELAAAQVAVLSVRQMAARLDVVFGLSAGRRTAGPRHQTLRACIGWSYDLLSPPAKAVLRRLSAFQGGWTLEAAEAVCAGEAIGPADVLPALAQLVAQSVVIAEDVSGVKRYRLLETIRQYAAEQAAAHGETAAARARHADYFRALATDPAYDWMRVAEQHPRAVALAAERDNLRAAMDWGLERAGPAPAGSADAAAEGLDLVYGIAAGLYGIWDEWGLQSEGQAWLERALALDDPARQSRARARALTVRALLLLQEGRAAGLEASLQEGIRIWRALQATGAPDDAAGLAAGLTTLGNALLRQGRVAEAQPYVEEGVAMLRGAGYDWLLGMLLFGWGESGLETEDLDAVQARLEESVAVLSKTGGPFHRTLPLTSLARVAWLRGDYAAAQALLEEALAVRREGHSTWAQAGAANSLAEVLRCRGEYVRAIALSQESLTTYREIGEESGVAWTLYNLGLVACYMERPGEAEAPLRESLAIRYAHANLPEVGRCLAALAQVAVRRGDALRAARLLGAAARLLAPLRTAWSPVDAAHVAAAEQAAQSALGAAGFAAAWAAGQTLPLDALLAMEP